MKKLLLFAAVGFMSVSTGACLDLNWWPSAQAGQDLDKEALEKRLVVVNEEMVLSLDGSRLYRVGQTGTGTAAGSRIGFTAGNGKDKVYIYSDNFLDQKGYGIKIAKYPRPCEGGSCAGLIEEKTLRFNDFGSVSYEIGRAGDRKTVLRFTPVLGEAPDAARPYEGHISLDGTLIKNGKEVVLSGLSATGKIIEGSAPGFGTFTVSREKFPGASQTGVFSGNTLSFTIGRDSFEWVCSKTILVEGRWQAWIKYDPTPLNPRGRVIRTR